MATTKTDTYCRQYDRLRWQRPIEEDESITRRADGTYDIEVRRHFDTDNDDKSDITFALRGNSEDRFFNASFSKSSAPNALLTSTRVDFPLHERRRMGGGPVSPLMTAILNRTVGVSTKTTSESRIGSIRVEKSLTKHATVSSELSTHETHLAEVVDKHVCAPILANAIDGETRVQIGPHRENGRFGFLVSCVVNARNLDAHSALEAMFDELDAMTDYQVFRHGIGYSNVHARHVQPEVQPSSPADSTADVDKWGAINARVDADPELRRFVAGDLLFSRRDDLTTVTCFANTGYVFAFADQQKLEALLRDQLGDDVVIDFKEADPELALSACE